MALSPYQLLRAFIRQYGLPPHVAGPAARARGARIDRPRRVGGRGRRMRGLRRPEPSQPSFQAHPRVHARRCRNSFKKARRTPLDSAAGGGHGGKLVHGYSVDESQRLDARLEFPKPDSRECHLCAGKPRARSRLRCGCANDHAGAEKSASRFHRHRLLAAFSTWLGTAPTRCRWATWISATQISRAPFEDGEFDGVFLCFVLEHLAAPENALQKSAACRDQGQSLRVRR